MVLRCLAGSDTGVKVSALDVFDPIENEFGISNTRGTVAMANSGRANSGGSQYFIATADIELAPRYTVFGTVVSGFNVLEAIAALPMASNGMDPINSRPLETIYLERVEVLGG